MQAIIIAGGAGTRLRPLTYNTPKPMVPLLGKPFLQYQLELLKRHGVTDVIINLHYLAQELKDYFGDGSRLGMRIQYSLEEAPMGTAGAVKKAEPLFSGETLLVFNADVLTDLDLTALIAYHREKQARATLSLIRVADPTAFGLVFLEPDGHIQRFLEKPSWDEAITDTVNAGTYVIEPEVFRYVPVGEAYSFERGLFPLLLQLKEPFYGCVNTCYWIDIGSPQKYMQVHHDVLSGAIAIPMPGRELAPGIWVGEGVEIDPSAELRGPIFLDRNVRVRKKAKLSEYTVLGESVLVDDRASLERVVVGAGSVIGEDARLIQCLIGKGCQIHDQVSLAGGAVLADNSTLARGTRLGVSLF